MSLRFCRRLSFREVTVHGEGGYRVSFSMDYLFEEKRPMNYPLIISSSHQSYPVGVCPEEFPVSYIQSLVLVTNGFSYHYQDPSLIYQQVFIEHLLYAWY